MARVAYLSQDIQVAETYSVSMKEIRGLIAECEGRSLDEKSLVVRVHSTVR